MNFHYADSQNQTCGPVELPALHDGLHGGVLTAETMVVEEGGSEWRPLSVVLRYFYSTGGEVYGPVRLADLPALCEAAAVDLMVMPEGGSEWIATGTFLRVPPPQSQERAKSREAPARAARTPFPVTARIAAVLWISFGSLKLVQTVVTLGTIGRIPRTLQSMAMMSWMFSILASVIILRAGLQTWRGSADDTRGNAHGSIGLGLVAAIAAWHLAGPGEPKPNLLMLLTAVVLFTAGGLALAARKPYLKWRTWWTARR